MKQASICKWYDGCPLKRYYENGQLEEMWITHYCRNHYRECIRYQMAETGQPHSDHLLAIGPAFTPAFAPYFLSSTREQFGIIRKGSWRF